MSESTYNQRYAALDSTSAGAFVFDTIAAKDYGVSKVAYGDANTITRVDASNPLPVTAGGAAHDAPVSGAPVLQGGYASATAPAAVNADGDAVRAWRLLNGAGAVVVTAAGALIGGDAANGLDVDITRVPAPLNVVGTGTEAAALRVTIASDSTGVLSIDDNGGTITVDGSVTSADSQVLADNAAFVDGTSKVWAAGYIYDETPGTALTENDVAAARIDSKRAVVNVIEDGTTRGQRLVITAAGAMSQNLAQYLGATASATNAIHVQPGTGASFTVVSGGNITHGAADSGNPVKTGGKARTTHPTAVDDADRVDEYYDDLGRPVVVLGCPRDLMTDQTTTITSSTAETTVLAAGAAGVFHDITSIVVGNSSATPTVVTFKESTGGTTRFNIPIGADTSIVFTPPRPIKQGSAANNWTATCADSVASVFVYVQAEKNV